jgi:hypothetical protein
MRSRLAPLFAVAAVAAVTAAAAQASTTPVGPLPAGSTATVATRAGELVAVALPHRSGGRSWRIARAFDSTVLRQVSEADVGSNVVLVFKTVNPGRTTLAFALTRGETAKANESRRFKVQVR